LVFDGLGSEPVQADVAVKGGIIVQVGKVTGRGDQEIDATGQIVTPGFVDIHTHYDGQVTWANRLAPSSAHGITTVVMGNCGVGFAPCRPADRDNLIRLMEGVEDIPGVVMSVGIPWKWETFPEYLDFLAGREYDMDIAAQIPHAPLRVYAMGQRGLDREPATPDDMQRMKGLVAEAVRAGALGIATSRSLNHRASDRHLMPNVSAAEGELVALGEGVREGGTGTFQAITDFYEPDSDFSLLRRVVERTGLPMSFTLLEVASAPERWRRVLKLTEQANNDGLTMKAQVFNRPVGVIVGLELNYNVFSFTPTYKTIAKLSFAERLKRLRDPALRTKIIAEYPAESWEPVSTTLGNLDNVFLMADQPSYEPKAGDSIGAQARAKGIAPAEYAYDLLIANDGKNVFYIPAANYAEGTSDTVSTMINHKDTLVGLGDGGAHVGMICDASATTWMLKRWAGDGKNGTMTLAKAIKALTSDNARAVNLNDRGVLAPGYRADINVIDRDRLDLHRPEMIYDLPDGAGRLHQRAEGYTATIVAGQVTYRDGKATGTLPGRLVRGAQSAPARYDQAAE